MQAAKSVRVIAAPPVSNRDRFQSGALSRQSLILLRAMLEFRSASPLAVDSFCCWVQKSLPAVRDRVIDSLGESIRPFRGPFGEQFLLRESIQLLFDLSSVRSPFVECFTSGIGVEFRRDLNRLLILRSSFL
jgi:hypothetical protein